MELLMMDAVNCYVQLHGYGMLISLQPDCYRALALNGVEIMNQTKVGPEQGIFTYIVEPMSCTASDSQYFNTFADGASSQNLIDYLESLANG